MRNIENLYQEMILEHNKKPRNFKTVSPCSHSSHGVNALCGDDYMLTVQVDNGSITDIGFTGHGCAISKSSGSLMTSTIKGKSLDEAITLKDQFLGMLIEDRTSEDMGRLAVFANVKRFPVRVKCATLIWRALEDALVLANGSISTEGDS
jgi:nitrogen fixation protein NifU and related proteins